MFTRQIGHATLLAMLCALPQMHGATVPELTDPQKQVTRLEYFYDQDPGFGKGVAVDFEADAQGRIQMNLNLPLDGLSVGMHQLFIRALNGRDEWSIAHKHTFFVTPFAAQTVPTIAKGEYFFGEDPEEGNGTTLLPDNPSGGGVAFSIQTPPMQAGHHTLQFRSQDSFGNWSMPLKHTALQIPDIRVTGVEWSVLEGEETIDSGIQPVIPPVSRFSGELNTSLLPDETFIERPFQAQARLILEERIPTVLQSLDLEIQALAEPLRIITPPRSQTVSVGDRFSLSVAVEGTGEKTFQWFHNDQPIAGAVGADLVLSNVQLADAGSYYVKIEGIIGNLQSQTAILTVNDPNPPVGEIVYHPADSNQDGRIVIGEVTAYGAAWKRGDTWPTEPNPIPIGYLTRAGALWKGGEAYEKDANVAQPPMWWVNPQQAARALLVYAPSVSQNKVVREIEQSSVQIDVQLAFPTQVYAVEESIPVGYVAVGISHGGLFDKESHQVRWGPFLDEQSRPLTYQIVAEQGVSGDPTFKGMASFDGLSVFIRDSVESEPLETGEPSLGIRIGEGGGANFHSG
ncbi:MAG: immunoglobulin domain-containing protein [Verrucomicrobiota bacterium]